MNVSVQLARNSGLRVRVNRKVANTAADNNKQGDVQAMEFGDVQASSAVAGEPI